LAGDAAACRPSRADASDRPVPPAAVCAVRGDLYLLLHRARPRLRLAAVLLPDRAAPLAGRNGIVHDAVAAGGRLDGADRRTAVGPPSARTSWRHRARHPR